jgi:hypothetical protein
MDVLPVLPRGLFPGSCASLLKCSGELITVNLWHSSKFFVKQHWCKTTFEVSVNEQNADIKFQTEVNSFSNFDT